MYLKSKITIKKLKISQSLGKLCDILIKKLSTILHIQFEPYFSDNLHKYLVLGSLLYLYPLYLLANSLLLIFISSSSISPLFIFL